MTNESKNIFITGIAGFLGSHLADALIADGHQVSGCDNFIGGYEDNVPETADFYEADCLDTEKMRELLEDIDIVYHTACIAPEGFSVFSPSKICENTYQATVSVASAAISQGVDRFVNCSSMARYGHQDTLPFTEDMNPNPQDPYGIAKLAAENTLDNLAEVHGIKIVHAIPHNIIGPRQKYDDPYRNVASIMTNLMLQDRQPVIYGDGKQQRCFSAIQDVVAPLAKLGFQENVIGERINIGPDEEPITIQNLAERLADIIGFDLEPRYMEDRPQEVKVATCSSDKSRELLDYETSTSLDEALEEVVAYIKERGPKEFDYHLELEINNDKTPDTWKEKIF